MENSDQPNAGNENTPTQDTKVEMSQEALNALIDKKYAKGAERAKSDLLAELGVDNIDVLKDSLKAQKEAEDASKTALEKANEQLEAVTAERDKLATETAKVKKQSEINSLAAKHGISDIDYLEYAYEKEGEGLDEESFINGLKESQPFLFAGKKPAKTDTTVNKQEPVVDKYAGMSFNDLVKAQQNL